MALADPKMTEAIVFFENMLQTMPKERTALEFLAVAYEQTEQQEKRRDILVRLLDVLLMESDFTSAKAIAEHLKAFPDHIPAMLAIERVSALSELESANAPRQAGANLSQEAAFKPATPTKEWPADVHSISHSGTSAEIDLVWFWHDNASISKALCMDIMNTLTDRPVTGVPLLISALAILDEAHPEYTDLVMEHMQRTSNVPPIPIDLFEPTPAAMKTVPRIFCQIRGVLPFSLMGNELLVALLNPVNEELKKEIRDRSGRTCHFFLTHPKSWQMVFDKAFATANEQTD
jgi:hypothetical protein